MVHGVCLKDCVVCNIVKLGDYMQVNMLNSSHKVQTIVNDL